MGKIAFLLHAAHGGGAERAMIAVANEFSKDTEVDLLLLRKSGPFLGDIAPSVRLVDLKAGRARNGFQPLRRYIRQERPRLVVSASLPTDVLALLGKAFLRWPFHLHISVQNTPHLDGARSGKRPPWPLIIKMLYGFANTISAISRGVKEDVEEILGRPGSIPVIHNPVDIEMVRRCAGERPAHPWFSGHRGPLLLAVGRLVQQKDVPTLLEAFRKVHAARPDARLIILGEGVDRTALEARASELGLTDAVAMPGFDANPFAAMANSDLFVLSSRWEGFANVVAEALACGTNVVSTDCRSGPAEILEHGRWGKLVPVGDADALAASILRALDEPLEEEALKGRAEAFELDRIVGQYKQLFRSLGVLA